MIELQKDDKILRIISQLVVCMVCIFCVNPVLGRLERLPVMIVIQTDGVLGSVVAGGQAGWVSTVGPGVGSVPSVATTVG